MKKINKTISGDSMKNAVNILVLLIITTNLQSMEKRKGDDQEQGGAKRPRGIEVPEPRITGFQDLPGDVQRIIFSLVASGRGSTSALRLQTAAENLRNFMTLNKAFKVSYLDNEQVNGYLIQQLAQRYTGGNLVEAAVALHTAAGGRWLATQIQQMPAGDQKNKIVGIAGLLLYRAAGDGDLGAVSFLLRFLPTIVNYRTNGNTALIHAVEAGHTEVVERLLAAPGINVNLQTVRGNSALVLASQNGHTAIVERILAVPGINVNLQNELGGSALSGASQNGHISIVEQLLAVPGINVNLQNRQGVTALMYAAQLGHIAVVERLLAVPGINVNLHANSGLTALKAALGSKSPNKDAIIKLLKDHGAVE